MTKIVGILNVTPDSFSDGGKYNGVDQVGPRIDELFADGADMIDVGAESTRPGANEITAEQEWQRLLPVLQIIQDYYSPDKFMLDTRHAAIAQCAIAITSSNLTINDVTGLHDPIMVRVAKNSNVKIVVGHLPALAHGSISMTHTLKIENVSQVLVEVEEKIDSIIRQGIKPEKIIVDPCIGFGKSKQVNKALLEFGNQMDYPVMIGYSRKRFIGERRMDPDKNVSLGKIAVQSGTAYLRVHDVAEHIAMLKSLS